MDYSDAYELAEEFLQPFVVDDSDDVYIPAAKDSKVMKTLEQFLISENVDEKLAADVVGEIVSFYRDPQYGR